MILPNRGEIEIEGESFALDLEPGGGAKIVPFPDGKPNELNDLGNQVFSDELLAVEAFASVGGEIDQALLVADADDQVLAAPHLDTAEFLEKLPTCRERTSLDCRACAWFRVAD